MGCFRGLSGTTDEFSSTAREMGSLIVIDEVEKIQLHCNRIGVTVISIAEIQRVREKGRKIR